MMAQKHVFPFLIWVFIGGFVQCEQVSDSKKSSCSAYKEKLSALSTDLCSESDPDPDQDGICNSNEEILGTDPNQKDIFVEIDYMENPNNDPGMTLTKTVLDAIKDAFGQKGIAFHADVGPYFTGEDQDKYDPENYNYCGGNEVPFKTKIALYGDQADDQCTGDCTTVKDLKEQYFDPKRARVFHYAVLANQSVFQGAAGLGDLIGRNYYITLGGVYDPDVPSTFVEGQLAVTIMHELGHNIGLSHAGDPSNSQDNYHPNYESIMNYGYPYGPVTRGDGRIWLFARAEEGKCDPSFRDTSYFDPNKEFPTLDFSPGGNSDLTESALDETKGYAGQAVDFNCSGSIENNTIVDLNKDGDTSDTVKDYDDWSNLILDPELYYQNQQVAKLNGEPYIEPQIVVCLRRDAIVEQVKKTGRVKEIRIEKGF